MPNADMLVLMAFPLGLLALALYRNLRQFSELGERRRATLPRLIWLIALAGVIYLAWLLMQE